MEEKTHPEVGDTLALTDIVVSRPIMGTGLPCGYELANADERFDEYHVEVKDILQVRVGAEDRLSIEELTLETEDGDEVKATYRGREKIAGIKGQSIGVTNSQNAHQSYNWHKVEA